MGWSASVGISSSASSASKRGGSSSGVSSSSWGGCEEAMVREFENAGGSVEGVTTPVFIRPPREGSETV